MTGQATQKTTEATEQEVAMVEQRAGALGRALRWAAIILGVPLAACLAGASFTNTGLGIVHALTHPVFNYFGGHHGTTNGILLAEVMHFNLPAMREKYAEMAPLLADPSGEDGIDPADAGVADVAIESVRALARDIGIPPTLSAIGAKEEYLDRMAMEATKSGTVQTNPVSANERNMKSIYETLME